MTIKKEQFLPTITTTHRSDWRRKIKEIDELGLKKVAIFPTCLDKEQRQEMYDLLEKTHIKEIPFVHLRSDMPPEELDYLSKRFGAKVFNTHSLKQFPLVYDLAKYKKQIFIENSFGYPWEKEGIEGFGGICLDFSHLQDDRLKGVSYFPKELEVAHEFIIGCNHISAVKKEPHSDDYLERKKLYSEHSFQDLSEFDYLKNYPKEFFSQFCAIEVENSLADQLKVIGYIVKTLNS